MVFRKKDGDCGCHFCINGLPHRDHGKYQKWSSAGHLQVAESLDPADILRTRICGLCAHEEVVQ